MTITHGTRRMTNYRSSPYDSHKRRREQPLIGSYRPSYPSNSAESRVKRHNLDRLNRPYRRNTGDSHEFPSRRRTTLGYYPVRSRSRSTSDDFDPSFKYLDELEEEFGAPIPQIYTLSERLNSNLRKKFRHHHVGDEAAYKFDFGLPWVRQLLRSMKAKYNCATVFDIDLLRKGDVIYFLEASPLGMNQNDQQGPRVAYIEGSTAAMKMKGRFGIVVSVHAENAKVALINTFNGEGLQKKNPKTWHEYVGINGKGEHEMSDIKHPFGFKNLQLEDLYCYLKPDAAVHLLTDKISINNHIMIAGQIAKTSQDRLKTYINHEVMEDN